MYKIISVVGARPNFVKLAAVHDLFGKYFKHIIVHTGQHYDYELSKVFFEHFSLPSPDYYLNIGSGTHYYHIAGIISKLGPILEKENPDLVVVYGDTNSSLAGALAAAKSGYRVAHIEAGLRCYDMFMPEEINRRLIDHCSWLLFAPTPSAKDNLMRENVLGEIHLVGDVHVDILKRMSRHIDRSNILDTLDLEPKEYIVTTIHRASNVSSERRLKEIVRALQEISREYKIVFPIHPRTRDALMNLGIFSNLTRNTNILIIKPLGYIDFIKLLKHSIIVITDSGGVQRESYLVKVKSVVLREKTEWVELVEEGCIRLSGAVDKEKIVRLVYEVIEDNKPCRETILGSGNASLAITKIIYDKLSSI